MQDDTVFSGCPACADQRLESGDERNDKRNNDTLKHLLPTIATVSPAPTFGTPLRQM